MLQVRYRLGKAAWPKECSAGATGAVALPAAEAFRGFPQQACWSCKPTDVQEKTGREAEPKECCGARSAGDNGTPGSGEEGQSSSSQEEGLLPFPAAATAGTRLKSHRAGLLAVNDRGSKIWVA